MTIEQMLERKKELGYSYSMLARLSGVPAATVQKVLGGVTKAPRYETICALERILSEDRKDISKTVDPAERSDMDSGLTGSGVVRESSAAYGSAQKKPGEYTLKDYYALPDERRVELIDGVFYDMSAPQVIHQFLVGLIHADLLGFVSGSGGSCLPLLAPTDVQLDMDDRTLVEPDVMVLCDRKKLRKTRIYGAPDLIIEVLSPSTRKRDLGLKMHKYIEAGVREYWIIWPDRQKVVTYLFEDEDSVPCIYSFHMKVPVGIWNGEHAVDFPKILEQISFMYDVTDES